MYGEKFSTDRGHWWIGLLNENWFDYIGEINIESGKYILQINEFSHEGVMDSNSPPVLVAGDFLISTITGTEDTDFMGWYEFLVLELYGFHICKYQSYLLLYKIPEEDFEALAGIR